MRPELPIAEHPRAARRCVALVACLIALAGCSWQEPAREHPPARTDAPEPPAQGATGSPDAHDVRVRRAVAVALDQLGTPYRYGGAAPGGFDCSGLVSFAYGRAGVAIPRTTEALWRGLRRVAGGEPRVGDLLFFRIDGKLSHVALYIGDDRFVHAPSSGSRVRVERMDAPFYARRLAGIARPLP